MIALVSLPDYDPNNPADALDPNRINRMAVGVYEMGSTFKALTTAMALDSGKVNINSSFDTRGVLRFGRFTIHDYHATNRVLTVPEIFIHSSNIGSARMALAVGVEGHKAFLKKMGQLDRMRTELPESAEPIVPAQWGELNTITIAFGHGVAVAPLQASAAVGALVNGGNWITPTFLKRDVARTAMAAAPSRDQAGDQRGAALRHAAQRREGLGRQGRGPRLLRRRQDRHGREGRSAAATRRTACSRPSWPSRRRTSRNTCS